MPVVYLGREIARTEETGIALVARPDRPRAIHVGRQAIHVGRQAIHAQHMFAVDLIALHNQ
jgi:hypothetical protein